MIVRWACVLAAAALVGCAGTASRTGGDEPDDPKEAPKESAVTLPSYPKESDLREFIATALTDPRVRDETFPFDRPVLRSERPTGGASSSP